MDLPPAKLADAVMPTLDSSIQPIIHSTPQIFAMSAIFKALWIPPAFMSLILIKSQALLARSSNTSYVPKADSSAMIGVSTLSVTNFRPTVS